MLTTAVVIAKARPEETVTVTDDEVRRVVQAIEANGMSVYLNPTPSDDLNQLGIQETSRPDVDDVCCNEGVVAEIFKKAISG